MDIASLLAEADKEVAEAPAYEDDTFEQEDDGNDKGKNAAEILRSAAQIIDKEEKYEAQQLFKESAGEMKEVVEQIRESQEPDRAAMNILLDASKEVNDMHRDANIEIVSPEVKKKVEIDIDEGLESDDEDEEFNDSLSQQLLHACHQGDLSKVEKLLSKSGVNLLYRDRHGWTPLHWAASKGHTDIIEELVKSRKRQRRKLRAFLEAEDYLAGWSPMHVCQNY